LSDTVDVFLDRSLVEKAYLTRKKTSL
jgi:hypothetical protein